MSNLFEYEKILIELAAYYEKEMPDSILELNAKLLASEITVEELAQARILYIKNPKNEFFPRPISKLIELIKTPVSTEDVATLTASLIVSTTKEFEFGSGWERGTNRNGETVYQGKDCFYTRWDYAAQSKLGHLGWRVVRSFGNWESICRLVYESPEGVTRAQLRALTVSLQNVKQTTGSYELLDYSTPAANQLEKAGDIIKLALKVKV